MRISLQARSVFCLAACLASPVAAQTNSVSIYVDDPRPVAEAVKSLLDRHPIVITYEDPRFEYSGDIKDVDAIRRAPAPPGTRRTLVPRGGILQASYDVSVATGEPADMREALRRILEANDAGPAGGRFKVLESGTVFHVVPTAIKDAAGSWASQPSVLDIPITVSVHDVNGFQLLDAIAAAINAASGREIRVAGGQFNNTFARYRGGVEAADEPARDVLLRALHSISERLTWRLLYGPSEKYYVLNLGLSAERPAKPEPLFQLPPPRPGDPTPAFRLPSGRPPSN